MNFKSRIIYKVIFMCAVLILFSLQLTSQNKRNDNPVEISSVLIIKKQIDGYNNRNIKKFLNQYSDSIKIYSFRKGLNIRGKNQLAIIYKSLFKNKSNLKRKITNTIVNGNTVVTNELVTSAQGKTDNVIAIYAIENQKIKEVHYVGSD